jgi:hypothetical protein
MSKQLITRKQLMEKIHGLLASFLRSAAIFMSTVLRFIASGKTVQIGISPFIASPGTTMFGRSEPYGDGAQFSSWRGIPATTLRARSGMVYHLCFRPPEENNWAPSLSGFWMHFP